ncbi:filamentous hemagglutinin N-terminal domain-containing protein [Aerosakkonemataceae cyanobacterium BLCC-F50]|uniref:Filamentous hemagglutinin N-terminal domain-containing protein n=1 Tax=Floridaenema flaviceps BLCC-F50 TaxID=3153642 RepID=A0ABV4XUM3_9CYAN
MIAKSWFSGWWQFQIASCVAIFGVLLGGVSEYILAQIVPDNTLGAESSVVTPNININNIPSDKIDGGAIRGANLFHSFSQFNIGEGRGAYFTNPVGILNILTRVTGTNRSEILGRLGVLGNANLFLINPNGIVFGSNASLDVQGSFLATTANAVKLGDAGLFSATQPATSNLLAVSPSALWFNAVAAQPLVNRSQAPSSINQPNSAGLSPGLQVQPGRTLALVGGDVLIEGGNLTVAGGRIELGSVTGVGQVSLTDTGNSFVLGYDSANNFGKIALSNGAFVDASGEGGGGIQIRGARLEMTQSSIIAADTLGAENGQELLVRATEIDLSERSVLSVSVTDTGTGTGGDLKIDTQQLLMRDGAQVLVITVGNGNSGRLQITASDSIELIGTSDDSQFGSGLYSQSQGAGDAGELRIDTKRLLVRDGAEVSGNTVGSGKGGRLQITASDSVEVIGTTPNGQLPSNLFAGSQRSGYGDAGELRINTRRLVVKDGGQVGTGTFGSGKGGNLLITASDSIELIGRAANGQFNSGLFTSTTGSGEAGDLTIDTRRLLMRDRAVISSRSTGEGTAGNINITARDSLRADNGTIGTDSTQSQGGAIAIRAGNIRLFGDSDIRSNVASGAGGGGNIYLKADSILAFDDSNILAFARDGRGGDITLDTPAFFGENFRSALSNTDPNPLESNNRVDINATGAISSGVITIPDVSFIQNSLTELPENQINTDSILASSCIVRRSRPTRGSFIVTGTGGLQERPGDAQMSNFPIVDVETLPSDSTPSNTNSNRPWQKGDPIVEPQGVYRLPNGRLVMSRECP